MVYLLIFLTNESSLCILILMKPFFARILVVSLIVCWSIWSMIFTLSDQTYAKSRWSYGSNPDEILKNVKEKSDPGGMTTTNLVQRPNLNSQAFGAANRVSNTLDQVRSILDPFVQRMVFIWLSFAVILIIRNAFWLSTSGITGDDNASKEIKTKIYNIIKWVIVITSWFYLIKLLLSAIAYILK